ncbi:MAG: nucleotide exchange factor GrpE [Planctomycetes bacterium UTPLA1]|nr:MAG: nucleotide exchange factor GrpE [Planctomycetes bacterium UTPLA1]
MMLKAEEKKKIVMPTDDEMMRDSPYGAESSSEAGSGASAARMSTEAGETEVSLRAQRDELQDKLLRAQAECANISKRMHQQNVEAVKYAGMSLAREVLHVVDSLDRSLAGFQSGAADGSVLDGIRLIADQLAKVLSDHGIKPIESVGHPFDPMRHEAMMSDYESDMPVGTVTAEYQRGYMMHDRVLRPAKVVVATKKADEEPDSA